MMTKCMVYHCSKICLAPISFCPTSNERKSFIHMQVSVADLGEGPRGPAPPPPPPPFGGMFAKNL